MTPSEIEGLPSFLAYLLVRYRQSPTWNLQALFSLVEVTLTLYENLLRAQLSNGEGLRPVAMGQRLERCLLLLRSLAAQGKDPLLQFVNEDQENPALRTLMSMRNKWAHSGMIAERNRPQLDSAMDSLLLSFATVQIMVVDEMIESTIIGRQLSGLNGLYEGALTSVGVSQDKMASYKKGDLLAVNEKRQLLPLFPYLDLAAGTTGENRVRLLISSSSARKDYLDPLDLFQAHLPTRDLS